MAERYQMIAPFVDHQVRERPLAAGEGTERVVSYGLSSYGYDFRIADEFQVPVDTDAPLDPKGSAAERFTAVTTPVYEIPAGHYVMGRTVEYFRIPRGVLTICTGKSTYARCGVTVYVTPFEPEWEGCATIAIVNSAGRPVKIYANEGIGQLLFLTGEGECATSYADKGGKYQAQQTITHAKV